MIIKKKFTEMEHMYYFYKIPFSIDYKILIFPMFFYEILFLEITQSPHWIYKKGMRSEKKNFLIIIKLKFNKSILLMKSDIKEVYLFI